MSTKRLTDNKAYAERVHFKKRLRERYGVRCNQDLYRSFVGQIKRGASTLILKQSNTRSVHEIRYNGRPIWVVYDLKRKELCTALPYNTDVGMLDERGRVNLSMEVQACI